MSDTENRDKAADGGLRTTDLFGWVACSERLPADFDCVVFTARNLGCFTGSRYKGEWRVYTPLDAADGRRIMIPITDLPEPTHWMPLPSLPNAAVDARRDNTNHQQDG